MRIHKTLSPEEQAVHEKKCLFCALSSFLEGWPGAADDAKLDPREMVDALIGAAVATAYATHEKMAEMDPTLKKIPNLIVSGMLHTSVSTTIQEHVMREQIGGVFGQIEEILSTMHAADKKQEKGHLDG
jgi:hypothetical protein